MLHFSTKFHEIIPCVFNWNLAERQTNSSETIAPAMAPGPRLRKLEPQHNMQQCSLSYKLLSKSVGLTVFASCPPYETS